MAQLIVRNLEDDIVLELKIRAAQHGRSAEAEHREILRQALLASRSGKSSKEEGTSHGNSVTDAREALLALCKTGRVKWNGGKPAGLRGYSIKGEPLAKTILDERR